MAVLSKKELVRRLANSDIVISPILDKDQIGPCSIDLRIGTLALLVRARGLSHVEAKLRVRGEHATEKGRRQKLDRHEIPFDEDLLLHPGMLTLVPTLEWVSVPNDLQGVVTARSSWAREGLNIATASFINPGYKGVVTLELSNLGQIPISLRPGIRICQIAFYKLDARRDPRPVASQFNMAFEPEAGDIAKGDEAFLFETQPDPKDSPGS